MNKIIEYQLQRAAAKGEQNAIKSVDLSDIIKKNPGVFSQSVPGQKTSNLTLRSPNNAKFIAMKATFTKLPAT